MTIDYTPKHRTKFRSNERMVMNDTPRANGKPVFEVTSLGTVIEFSDLYSEAVSAFRDAARPKQITRINWLGHRQCVNSENFFGK